jgi:hypothetical protein
MDYVSTVLSGKTWKYKEGKRRASGGNTVVHEEQSCTEARIAQLRIPKFLAKELARLRQI